MEKLAPEYCETFEIFEKVGPIAYQLTLPPTIEVHNVFHVFILNKYGHDATHVNLYNSIQLELEGEF